MTPRAHAVLVAIALSLAGGRVARSADTGREPHIVNGVPTQQRPTTGALLLGDPSTLLFGTCSGTLVGCQHVVTAAHCVCDGGDFASCGTPDPAQYRVYLQHAGVLPVSAISVNPDYSFATAGDVAVLTLASPLTGIHPTPIDTSGDPSPGMGGTIAGYGVTGGAFDDFGLLREGAVTVSSCGGVVPEPANVCWTFADPVGPPGSDSDTCYGDSGGPLFVNFGSGDLLGGLTSGGTSADCAPTDISYDANVYQNRAYIQSVAGVDLLNTFCGAITQVGDAGTVVTALRFDGLTSTAVACRKEVTKSYAAYAKTKLQVMEKCIDGVNKGSIAGPCPDTATADRITNAQDKIDPAKLGLRCTPSVIWTIYKANGCAGATDASGLKTCLLNASDTAVTHLLDVEYASASPSGPIADDGLLTCQTAIAKAAGRYGIYRLKYLTKCQSYEDRGTVAECPDPATQSRLAKLAAKVEPAIAVRCTDGQVATLNASGTFGDGCSAADSVATIAACEIAKHDTETNGLLALLDSMGTRRRTSFSVPFGTVRLRATVNGIDSGINDVDLFVAQGAPPTTDVYDGTSSSAGMYEGIDLASPGSGTWYALVQPYSGANVPFQLTITTFGP